MKAYVYPSGIRITPFDDPVAQTLIRNRTLEEQQADALRRAGWAVQRVASLDDIDEPSGLLISDHVFISAELLRKFRAAAGARPGLSALALASCGFTQFTVPIQDALTETVNGQSQVVYQVYAFNNTRPKPAELKAAARVPITIKEQRMANERVERVAEGRASFDVFLTRE